jgi:hypothetical protein
MWEGMRKRFTHDGSLDWDTGSKASVEWKKKNPKVPYPRDFNEAVRSASNAIAGARERLEDGYADLVKAYTKAKNVPRAKELRDEGAAVLAGKLAEGQRLDDRKEPLGARRYTFKERADLEEFVIDPRDGVAFGSSGLVIKPKVRMTHKIQFGEVSVSAVVVTTKGLGTWQFSNYPGCAIYGGGSIRIPPPETMVGLSKPEQAAAVARGQATKWWLDIGGLKASTSSSFSAELANGRLSWSAGGKRGELMVPLKKPAGSLVIETGDEELTLIELEIRDALEARR